MEIMGTTSRSETASAFHGLDELLLGPTDLDAMPFEFGCDFASAFEEKHLEPSHRLSALAMPQSRPKEIKRSHKRKSDSASAGAFSSRPLPLLAPPLTLDNAQDNLSSLDPNGAGSTQIGRWTKREHELFLEGLRLYGKSWKKISSLVVTRTLVQIRTHAQKYLQKQTKAALKAAAAAAASGTSSSSSKTRKAIESSAQPMDEDPLAASWKHQSRPHNRNHSQHASVFLPIAFPEHNLSLSSQPCSSSSYSASYPPRKEVASLPTTAMSKLDQILHDEPPHTSTASNDDYYASPTSSDDDLVQWLQHRHLPYHHTSGAAPAAKRRRTEPSSSHGQWAIVNPLETLSSYPSYYSSHSHEQNGAQHTDLHSRADFAPPLPAYATSSSGHDGDHDDFSFSNPWI